MSIENETKWTYVIYHSGSVVENIDADVFATEKEAEEAGESQLDDLCPPLSPNRKYYRAVTTLAD